MHLYDLKTSLPNPNVEFHKEEKHCKSCIWCRISLFMMTNSFPPRNSWKNYLHRETRNWQTFHNIAAVKRTPLRGSGPGKQDMRRVSINWYHSLLLLFSPLYIIRLAMLAARCREQESNNISFLQVTCAHKLPIYLPTNNCAAICPKSKIELVKPVQPGVGLKWNFYWATAEWAPPSNKSSLSSTESTLRIGLSVCLLVTEKYHTAWAPEGHKEQSYEPLNFELPIYLSNIHLAKIYLSKNNSQKYISQLILLCHRTNTKDAPGKSAMRPSLTSAIYLVTCYSVDINTLCGWVDFKICKILTVHLFPLKIVLLAGWKQPQKGLWWAYILHSAKGFP